MQSVQAVREARSCKQEGVKTRTLLKKLAGEKTSGKVIGEEQGEVLFCVQKNRQPAPAEEISIGMQHPRMPLRCRKSCSKQGDREKNCTKILNVDEGRPLKHWSGQRREEGGWGEWF